MDVKRAAQIVQRHQRAAALALKIVGIFAAFRRNKRHLGPLENLLFRARRLFARPLEQRANEFFGTGRPQQCRAELLRLRQMKEDLDLISVDAFESIGVDRFEISNNLR